MSQFVESLMLAVTEPRSRLAMLSVLADFGGEVVYLPRTSNTERRRSAATQMLESGWTAADAAAALTERFTVSLRTAQRDICVAAKTSKTSVADRD
jgi:hypothetical protein